MNGWSIATAVVVVLYLAFRLWLRWFSLRPLSPVDDYAVAVDADLDTAPDATTEDQPAAAAAPGVPTTPAEPASPEPPPVPSGRVIPRQRTAVDVRAAVPPAHQSAC